MQKAAWQFEVAHLRTLAAAFPDSHIFMEFSIPRMGRRADAVIVAGSLVFVLEYKVGEQRFPYHAVEQVHGYALDLKNFHATSHDIAIIPILISTEARPQPIGLGFWEHDRVHQPICLSPGDVALAMRQFLANDTAAAIAAEAWADGAYRPTPSIIEAAEALYRGHEVAEISRSEAGAENLTRTAAAIEDVVRQARANGGKAICFVTGVPGAGKTLAGLNIACGRLARDVGEDATFLSGNGPLVDVLREALRRDARSRNGLAANAEAQHRARRSPEKFIQNVHHFRDHYLSGEVPSEHVVIFDEAQRAWDAAMTSGFMRKRGHLGFAQSEPAYLLSVMDRRPDWCVVICLVGEGQEINRGEGGIAEWVQALAAELPHWQVHLSSHLVSGKDALHPALVWQLQQRGAQCSDALHLAVSVRSFRAEKLSAFVAALLGEEPAAARALMGDLAAFPIVRTRSLPHAKTWLKAKRRANERSGLLASSNALRLKPEGLFVKAAIDPCCWFLNAGDDVRASTALEDVATEFDVQGLELDWAGVAWDLNLRRTGQGWQARQFRGTSWQAISQTEAGIGRAEYVRNAYRVLLTRARQGMVIFVPPGDADDSTRPRAEYDAIDAWLADCGIPALA